MSAAQAESIHALHPEPASRAAARFLTALSILGAVLCVVGLALIISANWQEIHRWVKIITVVILLAGAHLGGYWLKVRTAALPRVGEALTMAGCILFLLGIALVSQIFHLDGRPGTAVLVWIAAIAPIPFLGRSPGAFFVLLLGTYAWLAIESVARDGWLASAPDDRRVGGASLPMVMLCGSLTLHWTAYFWRASWRRFARMQWTLPVLAVCLGVYRAGFSHKAWWAQRGALADTPVLLMLALAVLAGAGAAFRNWREWRLLSPWLVLAAVPAVLALGNFLGDGVRIATSLLSWVTLFVLNVFMIRAGLVQGRPWLVNTAIAFIALNIFTRYFDIFGSMLNQGMLFLVSGVVVLGLGWIEVDPVHWAGRTEK